MKKKGLLFLSVLLLSVLTLFIAGCGNSTSETPSKDFKTIELTFAGFMPANSPFEKEIMPAFVKEVEAATGGRVKIIAYPGGTLLEGGKIFDGVIEGSADMGHESLSWVEGRLPVSDMFKKSGVPFEGSKAASRAFAEAMEILDPEEYHDVKVLMFFCTGPGNIHSNVPIRSLEDLHGLEVRCIGSDSPSITALGAIPVTMTHAESYEALQKGIVKANLASNETLIAWNLAEVTKYTTITPFLYNGLQAIVMNLDVWNSLPEDIQSAIEEASKKVWEEHAIGFFDKQSEAGLQHAIDKTGQEVITLSEEETKRWKEKIAFIIDEYTEELNKRGLPGAETKKLVFELGKKYNEMYR
jgi:TRAP-type C4-dicarboxylate transport system substrate-binding protein